MSELSFNTSFRHADWQGNIAMVTGKDDDVEQHNGYYPYGGGIKLKMDNEGNISFSYNKKG